MVPPSLHLTPAGATPPPDEVDGRCVVAADLEAVDQVAATIEPWHDASPGAAGRARRAEVTGAITGGWFDPSSDPSPIYADRRQGNGNRRS